MGGQIECLECHDKPHSLSRHDFVDCKCGKVSVDGGFDYMKVCGGAGKWKFIKHSHSVKVKK